MVHTLAVPGNAQRYVSGVAAPMLIRQLLTVPIDRLRRDHSELDVLESIYQKALNFGDKNGFEKLSRIERVVVASWLTWGAMGNGGVYCAMNNPYTLLEAAEATELIGLPNAAKALRAGSTSLFPNGQSKDTEANRGMIHEYQELTNADADDLFSEYDKCARDLTRHLTDYIFDNWDEAVTSDRARLKT